MSLAVGFQIRHASPYVELAKRVHGGQIGAPVCGQIHYFASALNRPAVPNASPAELRLRNWVWDKILSGDIIVEQDIHIIDVTNWLLQGHPVKAVGKGGRTGRTDAGDASSHFNCVFTYPNDVAVTFGATQFGAAAWGVGMQYDGTKGCAEARYDQPVRISGETKWDVAAGQGGGGGSEGGADRRVPWRARRRGSEQAESVHREHHERAVLEPGDAGRGIRAGGDARPPGGVHRAAR